MDSSETTIHQLYDQTSFFNAKVNCERRRTREVAHDDSKIARGFVDDGPSNDPKTAAGRSLPQ